METGTITATGDLATDRASAIDAINSIAGQTGVSASDNGSSISLSAADGRNISVAVDDQGNCAGPCEGMCMGICVLDEPGPCFGACIGTCFE